MANSIVRLPVDYFSDPSSNRSLFNAKIYVGNPDTNPRISANQKTVTGRQEDGTEVPLAQPIRTSAGGYPTYNGSVVELLVDGAYSMAVDDRVDTQVFYFANVLDGAPALVTNSVATADTIADLRALEPLFDGQQVELLGHTVAGIGGGIFYADYSDLSSEVSKDPLNGLYVAFASDPTGASGAWVRNFKGGVNASWLGMAGGEVCGDILNSAIGLARFLGVNTVVVPNLTEPALLDKDVALEQATKIVGDGFNGRLVTSNRTGAAIKRSVANVGFKINGDDFGERIRWAALVGLSLDGGGLAGTLLDITTSQNLLVENCVIFGSADRAWHLKNTFDCWFYNCYFQTSGSSTLPATHLDDSTGSNTSHNNNIRFVGCTWEGNNGVPLRIDGAGTGPGNTQIAFDSRCKLENVGINTYQVVMIGCGSVVFNRALLVSRGSSGSIPGQVYAENVRNIQGHFDVAHNSGGGTLAAVVKLNGVSRSSFKLWPSEANVIDGLSGAYIFDNSVGAFDARVELSSEYMGSKSLANNNSTQSKFQPIGLDVPGATPLRLRRNGGTDANTAIQIEGASNGDIYVGKNSSGEFVVATSPDLDGTALFKIDRDGHPLLIDTQTTVGPAGGASALPATPSGYAVVQIGVGEVVIPYYNKL